MTQDKKKIDNIDTNPKDYIEDDKIGHSMEIKSIYYNIVKFTHPDRIKSSKLNELYIEATNAYKANDLITLYKVCLDLMIDFTHSEEDIKIIKERIEEYKNRISFLKETLTYKWIKTNNNKDKNEILLSYIKNKLN